MNIIVVDLPHIKDDHFNGYPVGTQFLLQGPNFDQELIDMIDHTMFGPNRQVQPRPDLNCIRYTQTFPVQIGWNYDAAVPCFRVRVIFDTNENMVTTAYPM